MEIQYSTDAVAVGQRFEYWNDVVCKHLIPAASRVSNQRDFRAHFAVRPLGTLTLGEMSSPSHYWERSARHLRIGPNEDFMLSLMLSGQGRLSQSGRQLEQRTGELALYDAARPFSYDLDSRSVLLLRVPRRQLLYRVPGAERLTATRLAPQAAASTLSYMMRTAATVDGLPPQAVDRLAGSLLEMLAVVLLAHAGRLAAPRSTHDVLFEQAKAYMAKRLGDPTLDMEQVAAAQRISTRTLTRVFAAHNLTPMQWLWQQRLQASYCALREARVRQVTQAAFDYGFSDLSHYCRVFKKTYGITPSQALRGR